MRFDHVGLATRDAADLIGLLDAPVGGLLELPLPCREAFDGVDGLFLALEESGHIALPKPADARAGDVHAVSPAAVNIRDRLEKKQ